MSGDNLHGKQPIKFYSEEMTLTKVELLERQLGLGEKVSNLELPRSYEASRRDLSILSKDTYKGKIANAAQACANVNITAP